MTVERLYPMTGFRPVSPNHHPHYLAAAAAATTTTTTQIRTLGRRRLLLYPSPLPDTPIYCNPLQLRLVDLSANGRPV